MSPDRSIINDMTTSPLSTTSIFPDTWTWILLQYTGSNKELVLLYHLFVSLFILFINFYFNTSKVYIENMQVSSSRPLARHPRASKHSNNVDNLGSAKLSVNFRQNPFLVGYNMHLPAVFVYCFFLENGIVLALGNV